jgi:hypothetical protein
MRMPDTELAQESNRGLGAVRKIKFRFPWLAEAGEIGFVKNVDDGGPINEVRNKVMLLTTCATLS